MKRIRFLFIGVLACLLFLSFRQYEKDKKILVFSKTLEFRHESIKEGIQLFQKLGKEHHFHVDTTENPAVFTDATLKKYSAIVFLSATGEVLDYAQQRALQRYIQAGGGFMGIHGASGALYHSTWYNQLIGAQFESHPPKIQKGVIHIKDSLHPATKGLPALWEPPEEWYNFKNISPDIHVLATVDESTYEGGKHGKVHPVFWCQNFDGGRSFYTALGHRPETYSEPVFIQHIWNGLQYVMGENGRLDYSRATALPTPESYKFTRKILAGKAFVAEPMELAVTKDGNVFYIERKGLIKWYNAHTKKVTKAGIIPVYSGHEDGLLGLTLDPGFEKNRWLYVFYSAPGNAFEYHLSRFTITLNNKLDKTSEKIILKIHEEHTASNHTGGSLAFDTAGNLFISVGDNTNPFGDAKGYAPIDERPGRIEFDAQRSSGNMADLRGKILRIRPQTDGTYTIPDGNLFPKDGSRGKPEIFIMGNRNPFRIAVDPKTSWLYWGEVGPDANKDSAEGTRGYDEINQAQRAGNFGWPYFAGDNRAYARVNFATDSIGSYFNPNAPENTSPNNTGARILPPAQNAFIWYPYGFTPQFPLLGQGARTAMAGPVYHFDPKLKSDSKLPAYYDKGLFIYDWMRNWIMVVRMDSVGQYTGMEPFMPYTSFAGIMDMEAGIDGALYILEYGFGWYAANPQARLSRLAFYEGKKKPSAIPPEVIAVEGKNKATSPGNKIVNKTYIKTNKGAVIIANNDCKACHSLNKTSVGPSFMAIAQRYKNKTFETDRLADKIINGGGGVWGDHVMSAHPQLSKQEAREIIRYILSLPKK